MKIYTNSTLPVAAIIMPVTTYSVLPSPSKLIHTFPSKVKYSIFQQIFTFKVKQNSSFLIGFAGDFEVIQAVRSASK
jgi:hypothetical protein